MANTIKVSVLGEVRDINQKLGQVNKSLGTVGKVAKVAGGVMAAAFAGGAVVSAVKSVVSAASDAQQSIGATETVFGKFSQSVIRDSNKAATQFGLDANTYRENANLLGSLFANQGVAASKLGGATKEMIGVGSDLAATFGGTTTDAVGALSAAFKGEFDSLEKYGISLKESTISAELAARGQDKLTGAALAAAKQQVTADLIMKQSAKTRGAFAKESDTLAHKQQVFAAQIENLKAKIGSALLPVLTKFVGFLSGTVLPKLNEWYGVFKDKVLPVIKDVGAWISANLLPPLQTLGNFLANNKTVVATFAGVILTIVGAMKAWAAVQAVLNAVMALNPIGLVVVAVAALAAGLVYAYKKSETFRNIVDGAFKAVQNVVSAVMPTIKNIIKSVWDGIQNIIKGATNVIKGIVKTVMSVIKGDWKGAWDGIKQILTGAWQAIKGVVQAGTAVARAVLAAAWNTAKTLTSNAWDAIKTAVSNAITKVVNFFKELPGKIKGALGNAATMLTTIGQNIISGLVNGIESAKQWVINKIQEVANLIPDWVKKRLGIASPSRVMKTLGKWVSYGLGKGITDGAGAVDEAMKGVTDVINNYYDKKIKNNKKAAAAAKDAIKSLKDEADALKKNANARKTNRDSLNAAITSYNDLVIARRKELGLDKTVNDLLEENGAALDNARSKYESLKQAAADYIRTVRDGFMSFGNIGSLIPEDMQGGNYGTIIANLQSKVNDANKFSGLIQQLAAQGLNQTNLDQLIQMGADAGMATAEALAAGGPGAIQQVNYLTSQLDLAGQNLGATMSARFHSAGINAAAAAVSALESQRNQLWATGISAAQGLVDGFESMGDRLERAGDRLAKKMVKAIKKALDINSPSRVFRRIGEQTTDGLVVGLKDTRGVERATFKLGRAMESSFQQPNLHATATASSKTGGDTININVTAPATVDKAALGREIASSLDSYYKSGGRRVAV